jgi:2-alkenal reductase
MKKQLLLVLGIILIVIVSSVVIVTAQGDRLTPLPAAAPYQANASEIALNAVYQSVIDSVVKINVLTNRSSGSGSGFVIDTNGNIVTNNHVVEGAEIIQVIFFNGTAVQATLVGRDPDSDLAVIHVDPSQVTLKPITLGNSDEVFVGQSVLAIGSPFEQSFTLTTGIVSALDRSISAESNFSIPEVIQTDAAINPGNSGGPLLDMSGRVIGVNSAILSRSNSSSGVGFAIPVNQVRRVAPYLIAYGQYQHSFLGISGITLQPAQRQLMNLPADLRGVMIAAVSPNGPAASAGLRGATQAASSPFGDLPLGGDIITSINGIPVGEMSELITYLNANTLPGDVITVQLVRDGQLFETQVQLSARP